MLSPLALDVRLLIALQVLQVPKVPRNTARREAAEDTEKSEIWTDGRTGTCVRARTSGCADNFERR